MIHYFWFCSKMYLMFEYTKDTANITNKCVDGVNIIFLYC